MRKKNARRRLPKAEPAVIGLAWYTEQNWQRVKEAALDKEDFDDTFLDWESGALAAWADFSQRGLNIVRWNVDADSLLAWCEKMNRPPSRKSIVEFVAHSLRFAD